MRFLFSSTFIQKSKRSHTMQEPRLVYVGSPAAGEPLGQPAPVPVASEPLAFAASKSFFQSTDIFRLLPSGPQSSAALTRPSGTSCCLPSPTLATRTLFSSDTE